jgi:predicted peptidase
MITRHVIAALAATGLIPVMAAPAGAATPTHAGSGTGVQRHGDHEHLHVRPDRERVYVSTFSWGSTLAYDAMSKRPGLFDAALINAGFPIRPDQAAQAATTRTPFWVTHGTSDPVLPVTFGRDTTRILREAYVAAGVDPTAAEDLIRFVEYPDEAYSIPDYHAVVGPTYEDGTALRWLLDQ